MIKVGVDIGNSKISCVVCDLKELDNPKSDSKQFKAPAYGLVLNYVSYE